LLGHSSAQLRRDLPQANFGQLVAQKADRDINVCRTVHDSIADSTLAEISPSEIRWSGIVRALIEYCLGPSAGETRVVICQSEFIRIGNESTLTVEKAEDKFSPERLVDLLNESRNSFISAPFVFGRDAATNFFIKLYSPTKTYPNRFWLMPDAQAREFIESVFSTISWVAPDGAHSHDLLWSHEPCHDMPDLMRKWLFEFAIRLHDIALPIYIDDAIALIPWVAAEPSNAESDEDE
jgi:hypothetical protein